MAAWLKLKRNDEISSLGSEVQADDKVGDGVGDVRGRDDC